MSWCCRWTVCLLPVPFCAISMTARSSETSSPTRQQVPSPRQASVEPPTQIPAPGGLGGSALKDAVLNDARTSSRMMYNTLLVQAQKLEVLGDRLILTFAASFKYGPTFDKYRSALEGIASKRAGRKITVAADGSGAEPAVEDGSTAKPAVDTEKQAALKEQALADAGVQALLEVFPAEIRDVEEM